MASSSAITLNDGTSIPILAYGTATALIRKDAKDWVKMAYNDAELRHIDTAAYYENEDTVGAALKELGTSREEIFITTKWLSLSDAWREMEALRGEGKAKSIGVSNYIAVSQLEETLKHAEIVPSKPKRAAHYIDRSSSPGNGKIEVHPYVYAKAKPIIDYCHTKGIQIACYTSLASIIAFPGGPVDAVVQKIASEIGATEDQVLMKWAHQVTYGGVVVTTSSKKDRLLGQMNALTEMKELTDEQIEEIVKTGAKKHQRVY
ncbi:hypothetical protein QFC20_006583 [Naganishia adeliensis]|uniref:Uncharacterized protein n=1 Tax=Naganishia adeliensis TaxID=92952 RepID=A0ACC2V9K0_9TREE|nr:hypothetical protein QFC20_006583 [Naganishia adeliensis]